MARFKGRQILYLAEKYPFDAFITADKNLPYQQNLAKSSLIIIVLASRSTYPTYLLPLMEKISEIIQSLPIESVVSIDDTREINFDI